MSVLLPAEGHRPKMEPVTADRKHRSDLGVAFASDEMIEERVGDIARLMLGRLRRAFVTRDVQWVQRYAWFIAIVEDLMQIESFIPMRPEGSWIHGS